MNFAASLTRSFEALGLRGAPTLLRYLSRALPAAGAATVTLPGGQEISFPAHDPYWCRYLYAGVPYEPDVEVILRRLAPGRVLIDCGANIGYWSVRAGELGFTAAIAIEANGALIPYLTRNYDGPVIHAAVYSASGERLCFSGEGATGAIGESGKPVQSIALKDLDVDGPAVIKLDVEGAEIPAIEGAEGMDAVHI